MRPPFALEYSALTSLCCYFVATPSATVLVPYQLWLEPTFKKKQKALRSVFLSFLGVTNSF